MQEAKEMNPSALNTQVDGNHYKDMAIQPVVYCQVNKLPWCEANIVKYVSRWRTKGGMRDLEKARHYLDMLIEFTEEEETNA